MTHTTPLSAGEPSSTRRLLMEFGGHPVLVLGDLILDEYINGTCSRISPEAPVPIIAVTESHAVLGGAANTANNITSLGGRAVLIGVIGADEPGRRLAAMAGASGIELRTAQHDHPTVRKARVVGEHQQLLRLDYESTSDIAAAIEARLLEILRAELSRCSIVVISDYAKGVVTERLCHEVLKAAHAAGKHVIVDPRPQHASSYVGCDYLTPNWKEALGLVGRPEVAPSGHVIDEVGHAVAQRFGAHVLLTLGAKGMKFFGRDGRVQFEESSLAKEVFDVSGAGDTVVATFALALAAGAGHQDAVALANRAAGIVVAKLGTATVSPGELLSDDGPERAPLGRQELSQVADRLRAKGQRIVTTNGSFDVLHAGHLHLLREARRQGDVLIVGLNSDHSVRGYKGSSRPFVSEQDRSRMLLALRDVDYVHIFDEPVPMRFLEDVRPDVHVNGSEYGVDCVEAPTVRRLGGRLHIVERLPDLSTTDLVAKIVRSAQAESSSPS